MYIVVFDDWMGLNLDRRFIVVGILFVLLSTLFATQYATTKVSFQYAIVHPSNADIRFIGSDNSSDDGLRVLRVSGDNGTNAVVGLEFGDWSANMNKTYTAAFCIVNEEGFAVNITHVTVTNISGTNDYMQVWLHGDRDKIAEDDSTSVFMYNNGTVVNGSSTVAWTLNAGNGNTGDMDADGTSISTSWDESAHVQYSTSDTDATNNGRSDFVWVQISINVPAGAVGDNHTGTVEFHFQATSHWSPPPKTLGFGNAAVFSSFATYVSTAALNSTQIVIAYRGAGPKLTAIVGTISGNSISFGGEVIFSSSTKPQYVSVVALDSTHIVIAYQNVSNSYYGTAIVGTISGNSISFGSAVVFESATTEYVSAASLDSTHVVIGYKDNGNSNYGTAIVGTISGNSISYGSPVVFESATTGYVSVASLDSLHVVIGYMGTSTYGTAIIGTISGSTISFLGSAAVFESAFTAYVSVARLDITHIVIGYYDGDNSNYGTAIVGTISGSSISFGGAVVFESASTSYVSVATLDSSHVVIGYRGTSGYGRAIVGTISGTSISFGSAVVFESTGTDYVSAATLDITHIVIGYHVSNGKAIVGTYS